MFDIHLSFVEELWHGLRFFTIAGSAVNRLSIGKGSWVKFLNIFPFHKQLGGDLFRVQRPKPRNLKVTIGGAGPIFSLRWFWAQQLGHYQVKSGFLGDQLSKLKICSPKICLTWPTTLGGLMPYMEVTSLQCKWVCSLQVLTTWEKGCQRTHIWCSQPQLLAWTSPLCWMDVSPLQLFWLPRIRQSAECWQGVECRRRLAWWWQVWSRG